VWGHLGGGVIRDNRIMGNVAADHGGGVVVSSFRNDVPPLSAEISWNVISDNVAEGFEQTGESGGGLVLAWSNAWVHHNTIVGNVGRGGLGDWGGGIYMFLDGSPLVENNIIALSPEGGGILCKRGVQPTIRNNLAWHNLGGEGLGECSDWWASNGNILADPQFCDPDAGIYSLAESSPALSHPAGPLGAFSSPGCEGVLVVPTTWGRIKRTFSK